MEKNILLTIEYDGTCFSGWQRQPQVLTAQGKLEEALSRLLGKPITVDGTSRTDAGVHALGQRASFKGDFGIPVANMKRALNDMLSAGETYRGKPAPLRVLEVEEVPMDFHARFNCKGKKYRYIINTGEQVDIFRRNYCYQLGKKLDVEAMRSALRHINGTHDFKAFQASGGTPRETTVRTIFGTSIEERDGQVIFEVAGDGFLYNMVRIMVGTLIEVGLGKIQGEQLEEIIASGHRQQAGFTAPAEGLYLVEIYYSDEEIQGAFR